ncbi:protein SERAC1 [Ischnura elegans]|uniref:protein SERAC1 n=1 Tax=Ischnura elegans TaxID=197161 RepID=UPI001ED88332|nr:protein SERAC1 [Ischnura elegans]XP_046386015.1 protein SERAC1 [Ischnura elegans]XP_046386016.1 protein SERAC1 [Ischnura elegans]
MKKAGVLLALAGAGWASYQIHHAYQHLYNILPANAVEHEDKLPEYIYYQPKVSGRAHFDAIWLPQYVWWWNSVPSSLAWRLLDIAQNGNRKQRLKAVHSLAHLENLEESDYRQLAQACDPKTAVGLARTNGVDLRLFLKPPNYPPPAKKEDLVDCCHEMLKRLDTEEAHECVRYFVTDILPEVQERHAHYSSRINQEYLLTLCLKSLLHHSNLPNHSAEIVRMGGLKLLMDIYYHYSDSNHIVGLLGKIISNISEPSYRKQMLSSGWIGALADLLSSSSLLIKSCAGKALANMDEDELNLYSYRGGVYLLHPLFRSLSDKISCHPNADVVFVHGLLGGVFWTWRNRDQVKIEPVDERLLEELNGENSRQEVGALGFLKEFMSFGSSQKKSPVSLCDCPVRSKRLSNKSSRYLSSCFEESKLFCPIRDVTECWPVGWLAKDLPCLRVIGLNYDTHVSLWVPVCPEESLPKNLEDRSEELIQKLLQAGLGKRPIIWVAHSMGGLIVKNILVRAFESGNKELRRLSENTKGAVFFSVPHFGSHLVDFKQATKLLLLPTNEVSDLRHNSPTLLTLHERFVKCLESHPIKVLSFVESENTAVSSLKVPLRFVSAESADPGVGEFYEVPLNHLEICKPSNRRSFLYQKLLTFIDYALKSS